MDLYNVDYINPALIKGNKPMPQFVSITVQDDKIFNPDSTSIGRRVKATDQLGKLLLYKFHYNDEGLLRVPYILMHHKSAKSHCGFTKKDQYDAPRQGQYLLQKISSELDFTLPVVKDKISKFVKTINEITADIRVDMRNYFKYWLHSLFQDCCDHIKLKERPHVQNYSDC
jgi:hypothetical protein